MEAMEKRELVEEISRQKKVSENFDPSYFRKIWVMNIERFKEK